MLSIVRAIVEKTETENPDADGPTKLETALQDLEVIAAGLGEAWGEVGPAVRRMVDAAVALFHRIGKFVRRPKFVEAPAKKPA